MELRLSPTTVSELLGGRRRTCPDHVDEVARGGRFGPVVFRRYEWDLTTTLPAAVIEREAAEAHAEFLYAPVGPGPLRDANYLL